jgi:hypothetical protein
MFRFDQEMIKKAMSLLNNVLDNVVESFIDELRHIGLINTKTGSAVYKVRRYGTNSVQRHQLDCGNLDRRDRQARAR